jgi:hypothetical protein
MNSTGRSIPNLYMHSPTKFVSFNLGDVKGTIRSDVWLCCVSNDVRRHRLISIRYISLLPCHGRGRGFESRRPAIIFKHLEL